MSDRTETNEPAQPESKPQTSSQDESSVSHSDSPKQLLQQQQEMQQITGGDQNVQLRGGQFTSTSTTTVADVEQARTSRPSSAPSDKPRNPNGDRPDCFANTFQEVSFIFLATVAMATNSFLVGSTSTITAPVGKDLHMSQSQITWITAAATLVAGAFQLPLGQLSDLLGRKILFLTGMIGFSAGCLLLSFAKNPFWMDIMTGVLGLLSAMVVPPMYGILGSAYSVPSRRKNFAFATFSSGNPLGFALGSVSTGVASRIFNWRAAYIFLAILWAFFAGVAVFVVPSNVEAFEPGPFWKRLIGAGKVFDFLGTFLIIVGVGLFAAALTLGPSDGWSSGQVIAMLIVGILLMALFVVWEHRASHPLMPMAIWQDRTFSLLVAIAVLGLSSFVAANFWLSFLMQTLRNYDALDVAVHLLPQVIAGILWNILAANIMHRVNNTLIMGVGALGYFGGSLLLSFQKVHSDYWAFVFPAIILNVLGADLQFNVSTIYVMQSLPSSQQSLAGGIINMLTRLGTTIGLGIATAVYTSEQQRLGPNSDPVTPFQRAFDVSVGFAGIALLMVPFVKLNTQGHAPAEQQDEGETLKVPVDEPAQIQHVTYSIDEKPVKGQDEDGAASKEISPDGIQD